MKEIYVSSDKEAKGNGTLQNPYGGFGEALEIIRTAEEDITVYMLGGRYFFTESLVIDKTAGGKVRFVPYGTEKVYFDGGVVLDADSIQPVSAPAVKSRIIDKDAAEKVLEIDLSGYGISYGKYGTRGFRRSVIPSGNELYVNGEPYLVAQYPNKGEALIPMKTVLDGGSVPCRQEFDMRPATFVYEDPRCDLWKDAKGFYMSGLVNTCFADDTLEIASLDTEKKTMTTVLPHLFGFKAQSYTAWYAIHLLEEIDLPGEYFVDTEAEKVYFYPKGDVKDALIQLSVLAEPMVVLENVSDITFEGITFENSRGTGAYIERGENCLFRDCVFRNLGMIGVQIGQGATSLPEGMHTAHGIQSEGTESPVGASRIIGSWHEKLYQHAAWNNEGGKHHGIVNCEIYNTGTGGILLGGGDRKTLEPAGNYVENCGIHNVNRLDRTYKAGVNLMGVGNRVSHCEIYDLPGFAIYLHGNDHVIEYNKIHNVVTEVADAGAIYWGRDLSEVGNEVRYNFFYNIHGLNDDTMGVCAVYLDDYASFNKVYENYFYDITQARTVAPFGVIFWNRGGQTSVNNNIFISCNASLNPGANNLRGVHKVLHSDPLHRNRVHTTDTADETGVDITSPIWRKKYPYLYQLYEGTYTHEIMVWNNLVTNEPGLFRDAENLDFTIVSDKTNFEATAHVYDPLMGVEEDVLYFKIVDFGEIGRK